jgi:hypothetical protein
MLTNGHEASHRLQAAFILAQSLGPSDMDRRKPTTGWTTRLQFMPRRLTAGARAHGWFGRQDFFYLPEQAPYRCLPAKP